MVRAIAALLAVCTVLLTGCVTAAPPPPPDINAVARLATAFGPDFATKTYPSSGIDPASLGDQQLPPGLSYTPAECATLADRQGLPAGRQGNMAATAAEGAGQRFIVIALQTSEAVTVPAPPESCRRVDFAGGALRGVVEVIDAPPIPDAQTVGVHRVVEQVVGGRPARGELYNYVARFGAYQVIVVASPQVLPGRPVAPVDTAKARDLLTAAVAAVRG